VSKKRRFQDKQCIIKKPGAAKREVIIAGVPEEYSRVFYLAKGAHEKIEKWADSQEYKEYFRVLLNNDLSMININRLFCVIVDKHDCTEEEIDKIISDDIIEPIEEIVKKISFFTDEARSAVEETKQIEDAKFRNGEEENLNKNFQLLLDNSTKELEEINKEALILYRNLTNENKEEVKLIEKYNNDCKSFNKVCQELAEESDFIETDENITLEKCNELKIKLETEIFTLMEKKELIEKQFSILKQISARKEEMEDSDSCEYGARSYKRLLADYDSMDVKILRLLTTLEELAPNYFKMKAGEWAERKGQFNILMNIHECLKRKRIHEPDFHGISEIDRKLKLTIDKISSFEAENMVSDQDQDLPVMDCRNEKETDHKESIQFEQEDIRAIESAPIKPFIQKTVIGMTKPKETIFFLLCAITSPNAKLGRSVERLRNNILKSRDHMFNILFPVDIINLDSLPTSASDDERKSEHLTKSEQEQIITRLLKLLEKMGFVVVTESKSVLHYKPSDEGFKYYQEKLVCAKAGMDRVARKLRETAMQVDEEAKDRNQNI